MEGLLVLQGGCAHPSLGSKGLASAAVIALPSSLAQYASTACTQQRRQQDMVMAY
jgi:hypothetical protein